MRIYQRFGVFLILAVKLTGADFPAETDWPAFRLGQREVLVNRAYFRPFATGAHAGVPLADGHASFGRQSIRVRENSSEPDVLLKDEGFVIETRRGGYFDLWAAFDQTTARNGAAGLAFVVKVAESRKSYIAIGCDDGYRLRLNGRSISTRIGRRDLNPDEDLVELSLTAGNNQVEISFFKGAAWRQVPNDHFGDQWGAALKLYPDAETARRGIRSIAHHFLETPIVTDFGALALGIPGSLAPNLVIRDVNLKVVWQAPVDDQGILILSKAEGRIPPLPFLGFACVDSLMMEPIICVASFDQLTPELAGQLGPLSNNQACRFRLRHLLRPEFTSSRDRWWARKLTMSAAMALIGQDDDGKLPEKFDAWPTANEPFVAYSSHIDGRMQFYRYSRSRVQTTPRRLAIFFPGAPMPVRPYLESHSVSDIKEAETLAALANAEGIDLLWPGNVDVDYGGEITLAWVKEAVADCLKKRYGEEPVLVFPVGTCAAGVGALKFAANVQNIGGVVLWSPVPFRATYRWPAAEPAQVEAMPVEAWRTSRPADLTLLKDIPMFLRFDIDVPGHGDRLETREFVRDLRSAGGSIEERWLSDPDPVMEWGMRGTEAQREWMLWMRRQNPLNPARAVPHEGTESVQELLLKGFQVKTDGSSLADAWADKWHAMLSTYRGDFPSASAFDPKVLVTITQVGVASLPVLIRTALGQTLLSPATTAAAISSCEGWMMIGMSGNSIAVHLSDNLAANDSPPIDILKEGCARGVLWIKRGQRWLVVQVWQ